MAPRAKRFQLDLDHPSAARMLHFPDGPDRGGDPNAIMPDKDDYSELPLDHHRSVHWRGHIGSFIAEQLGHDLMRTKAWHVSDWPHGYTMWMRTKGARRDYYLFGYKKKARFSSPQEFAFHAMWLYHDQYHEFGKCECTLCTNRPQKVINALWEQDGPSFTASRSGGGGGGGGGRGGRGRDPQPIDDDEGPHADLPSQPKVVPWTLHKKLFGGSIDLPEREADLDVQRPFRTDELVWVSIPPIHSPDPSSGEAIELWPAIIKGHQGLGQVSVCLLMVGTTQTVEVAEVLSWQCIPLVQTPQLKATWKSAARSNRPVTPFSNGVRPWDDKTLGTFAAAIFAATSTVVRHFRLIPDEKGGYDGFWWGPEVIWIGDMVRITPDERDVHLAGYITEAGVDVEDTLLFGRVTAIGPKSGGQKAKSQISMQIYALVESDGDEKEAMDSSPYRLPTAPPGHNFDLINGDKKTRVHIYSIAGRYDPLPWTSVPHGRILRRIRDGKFLVTLKDVLGLDEDDEDETSALREEVKSILDIKPRSGGWVAEKKKWEPRRQMLQGAERRGREWLEGRRGDSDDSDEDSDS